MKHKILTLVLCLMGIFATCFHASADQSQACIEVFKTVDYADRVGLTTEYGESIAAGTTMYSGGSFDVILPFDQQLQRVSSSQTNGAHQFVQIDSTIISIETGVQGRENAKTADGVNPCIYLMPPVSGYSLQINAKVDGKVVVLLNAISNKQYFVFENGNPLGYSFAMQTYAETMLGDNGLLTYTLTGNELNYLSLDLLEDNTGFRKIEFVENYVNDTAISGVQWGQYRQNGVGMMAFDAYANCTYLVGGAGTKAKIAAVAFITEKVKGKKVWALGENVTDPDTNETINYPDVLLMTLSSYGNEKEEAFVAWCAGNTTLYFDYGVVPEVGDTYNGQTVTNVWSGTTVTDTYAQPQWIDVASSTCTNVVFMPSFANAVPVTCYAWFNVFINLTSINGLNYLNTANVTNMNFMFSQCWSLTSLDLSSFNTTNVTSMYRMFHDCHALTSLNVSNFNTANVTDMGDMFNKCYTLTSLDLSSFNTQNVTDMFGMFRDCNALTSLDLSSFNTQNVTDMRFMFGGCSSLTSIDVSDEWTTARVSVSDGMFSGCTNLVGGNGTTYNSSHTDASYAHIDEFGNPGYLTYAYREAFVVWCSDNTTLYFDYGTVPEAGDTYNAQIVTNVWSGTTVTDTYAQPQWIDVASSTCTNVVFMPSFANVSPTSCIWWFHDFQNLTTIDNLNYLNTANVTDMYGMFQGCSALTSLDVSNFNTANVTNMEYMFSGCSTLASLDMSGFSTENVMYMNGMFSNCSSLTTLDLSNFNTSNVMDMASMFNWCLSLSSLDVSNFNTANVIYMGAMFAACTSIASLDLRGFNTANVTDMGSMFYGCNTLTSILVSDKWTTALVKTSSSMFSGCTSLVGGNGTIYDVSHTDATYARIDEPGNPGYLTRIGVFVAWCADNTTLYFDYGIVPEVGDVYDGQTITDVWSGTDVTTIGYGIPAWNSIASSTCTNVVFKPSFANVFPTSCYRWFYNFQNLTTIDGLNYLNTANVTNMSWMFKNCTSLTSLAVSSFNTDNVTVMNDMFSGCSTLASLDVSSFGTENVTYMHDMFRDCVALTSLDVSGFNTANVTDMSGMFYNCQSLISLNVSGFNTTKVTSVSFMFSGCSSLASLDLSNFNTSKVTNMRAMFQSCYSLSSLDVSDFNTANVTNMEFMFSGCSALTSLDISRFCTTKVTGMDNMFQSCYSLITLFVSDVWSTNNVNSSNGMFGGCTHLVGGNGTTYDGSHIDATYAHIDVPGNPGYLTRKTYTITLTDDEPYSLAEDSIFDAATYQKTLGDERVGKYQAWMVPFDYVLTDDDMQKFNFYRIHMIADSPEPGEGDETGELWIYLKNLNAGYTLKANMPYVYKPKEAVTDYEFTSANVTLKAPQAGVLASTQTMDDIFSFYATYDFTSPSALDPFYYVNIDGGLSLGNESSVVVGPYRWILRVTSKNGAASAPVRTMHFVDEENGAHNATNLSNTEGSKDGLWYATDGRLIGTNKPATRGIYIRNGKKEVIY